MERRAWLRDGRKEEKERKGKKGKKGGREEGLFFQASRTNRLTA